MQSKKHRVIEDSKTERKAASLEEWLGDSALLRAICVVGLLMIHVGLAVSSVHDKSTTFDEIAHLTRGVSIWRTWDYRLVPESVLLVPLWAGWPVASGNFRFPDTNNADWRSSNAWKIGWRFFYGIGNDVQAMLFRGRCMVVLLSAVLGLIVWLWSRWLFGELGGLVSLVLYSFSPTMLAHGRLVTMETAASLFFLAAVGTIFWLLRRVSVCSVIVCAISVAGLVLSKMSALMIIPISGMMVAVRLVSRCPTTVVVRRVAEIHSRGGQLGVWLGAACVEIGLVILIIWAAYGFEYSAMRGAKVGQDHFFTPASLQEGLDEWEHVLGGLGAKGDAIRWARNYRVLPESYLYGLAYTLRHARMRVAFMNGKQSSEGWWYFFPYSFAVKTPLPLFGVILLAVLAALFGKSANAPSDSASSWHPIAHGFYRTTPLWSLFTVYCTFAIGSHLNIGHRHIVPIYPVLFIFCGCAVKWMSAVNPIKRWILPQLIGIFIVSSLLCWPDYLSYFNFFVGGPSHGYKHLVDSSLDWGQDLPGLKKWLDKESSRHTCVASRVKAVYLSYFGTGDPSYYGIEANMLPSYLPWPSGRIVPFKGGIYCISASTLQQTGLLSDCRWTPALEEAYQSAKKHWAATARSELAMSRAELNFYIRLSFGRLCAFLRQREPDDQVGYSIMIYCMSDNEVRRALFGSPPELLEDRTGNLRWLLKQCVSSGNREMREIVEKHLRRAKYD